MKWEKRTENSCFCSTLTRAFGRGEWALFSCHLIFNNIETNKNTTFLFIQLRHRSIRFIFTRLNWKKGMCFDISLSFLPIHYFFYHHFMLSTMEKLIAVRLMTILNPLSADLNQSSPEETQPTGKIIIIITATKIHIERKKHTHKTQRAARRCEIYMKRSFIKRSDD